MRPAVELAGGGRRAEDPLADRVGAFLEALAEPGSRSGRLAAAARRLEGVPGLTGVFTLPGSRGELELHPTRGAELPAGLAGALEAALGPVRAEPRGPGVPRQVEVGEGARAILFWGEAESVEGPELLGGLLIEVDSPLTGSTEAGRWLRFFELALGRDLAIARLEQYREAVDLMNLLQPPLLGAKRGLVERVLARLRALAAADLVALAWLEPEAATSVTWLLPRDLAVDRLGPARDRLVQGLGSAGAMPPVEQLLRDEEGGPARDGPLTASELTLPLLGPGGADLGRLSFFAARTGVFGHHAMTLLGSLAPALAGALGRLAGEAELRDRNAELERVNARVDAQLELARRIQSQLASPCPPPPRGLVVAERARQAAQVGGDFFAAQAFGRTRYGVAVADVSGKGLPSGLLMAHTRGALLAAWEASSDPAAVLDRLNRVVYDSTDDYLFVTMLILVVDLRRGVARFACAGHEPLRRLTRAGEVQELTSGDPPLGIMDGNTFELHEVPFERGDALLLLTDGCHDQRSPAGERFGRERLDRLLREVGPRPQDLVARVMGSLDAWRGAEPAADDATCVALGRPPP